MGQVVARVRVLLRIAVGALALMALALALAVGASAASRSTSLVTAPAVGTHPVSMPTFIHTATHQVVTTVPAGTNVHVDVTVIGAFGAVTGTVTAYVYEDATCTGFFAGSSAATALVSGTADITAFVWKPLESGKISFQVHYSGNASYAAADGPCVVLTVTKVAPTIRVVTHDASHTEVGTLPEGQPAHPAVTVTGPAGTATGAVVASWYGEPLCAGSPLNAPTSTLTSGARDFTGFTESLTISGQYSWKVHYVGDGSYTAGDKCTTYTVSKIGAGFSAVLHDHRHLALSVVPVGEPVHVKTAFVASVGPATGTIVINEYPLINCGGTATKTTYAASAGDPFGGSYTLQAPGVRSYRLNYSGDIRYVPGQSACLNMTWKPQPTFDVTIHDASHDPVTTVVVGTPVHLRVVVSGGYGTVTGTFREYRFTSGNCLEGTEGQIGTVTLPPDTIDNGAWTYTPNTPGTYSFQAGTDGAGTYTYGLSACIKLTVTLPPTPSPTAPPTPAPTAAPTPKPSKAPGATPTPTTTATAAPGGTPSPLASVTAPTASPAPGESALAGETASPAASGDGTATSGPGESSAAAASAPGTSPGTGGPSTPAGDSSGLSGPLLVIVAIVAIAGLALFVAVRRRSTR